MRKLLIALTLLPPLLLVVVSFLHYRVDSDILDFYEEKSKKGDLPEKHLLVEEIVARNLSDELNKISADNVKITFEKTGQSIKNLYSVSYQIKNFGESPILATDFKEPLKVSFNHRWKILAAQKGISNPRELEQKWEVTSENTLEIKPMLLNPGDIFWIEIYLFEKNDTDVGLRDLKQQLKGKWSTRIINLKNISSELPLRKEIRKRIEKEREKGRDPWFLLGVEPTVKKSIVAGLLIIPTGWAVYALVLIALVIQLSTLYFIDQIKRLKEFGSYKLIAIFISVSTLSFAIAESYTHVIIHGIHVSNNILCYIFILVHLGTAIFLINKSPNS